MKKKFDSKTTDNSKREQHANMIESTIKTEPSASASTYSTVFNDNQLEATSYPSCDTVNDCMEIKQEIKQTDTKRKLSENKSNTNLLSDFSYCCKICNDEMPDLRSVYQHRITVHGIKGSSSISVKHMDLTPDVSDPNYYCKSCEKYFKLKPAYRSHLKAVHYMKLPNLPLTQKRNSDPDPNDPKFYCCSCERHYKNQRKYRLHLRRIHKMNLNELFKVYRKNPDILPDWHDPNNYCRSCKRTYADRSSYKHHCKTVHQLKQPKTEKPNRQDPNFYCNICKVTFMYAAGLRYHCRYFHQTYYTVRNTTVIPDISDPSNYCKSCEKKYFGRKSYIEHLQYVHRMLGPPLLATKPRTSTPISECTSRFLCCECGKTLATKLTFIKHFFQQHSQSEAKKNPDEFPDPDDPSYYCRICERKYPSKTIYRSHLRGTHWMRLESLRFRNSSLLPNPSKPNLYCPKCKRNYSSACAYRIHCQTSHQMT